MSDDLNDDVVRLSASGRAFLRRLEPESSLQAIESTLVPTDLDDPHAVVVLALDFDQTVKLKDRSTNRARVRGDEASVAFLRRVHALTSPRVALCVITAADVSVAGVRGIAGELDQLGIADLFDCDALCAVDTTSLAANAADSRAELRAKLCALLVLVPPTRFGADLLRIARNSVVVRDSVVEFRLVKDRQRGALLRVSHAVVVDCWRHYHAKANVASDDADDEAMYFSDDDDVDLVQELTTTLRSLGCIPERHIARLLRDTAAVHDIDGVKVARFGRVLCSKYNKPEALQLFLAQEQLAPRTIVFVDDNLTNAFNMFAAAATSPTATTSTTTSFWFEPPAGGKEETVRDERAIALARALIAHFDAARQAPPTTTRS